MKTNMYRNFGYLQFDNILGNSPKIDSGKKEFRFYDNLFQGDIIEMNLKKKLFKLKMNSFIK